MAECANQYTLPTIEFVGGESQTIRFKMYYQGNHYPFSMVGCTSYLSIVSYTNKFGSPIIRKEMNVDSGDDGTNVLSVRLSPDETYELYGKYIYQISIRDVDGNVEIPKQGIMLITNNIDKNFIQ